MAEITEIIPASSFELVRDRIGAILAVELANQAALTTNPDLINDVWVNRDTPFDIAEVPCVNVRMNTGSYASQHQGQTEGTYMYYVDVYTRAEATPTTNGDINSAVSLDRLLAICRYILDSPKYITLGFARPFIQNRKVIGIAKAEGEKDPDMENVLMGRITYQVMMPENELLNVAPPIAGALTTVKLEQTTKGYKYAYES